MAVDIFNPRLKEAALNAAAMATQCDLNGVVMLSLVTITAPDQFTIQSARSATTGITRKQHYLELAKNRVITALLTHMGYPPAHPEPDLLTTTSITQYLPTGQLVIAAFASKDTQINALVPSTALQSFT